MRIPKPGARSQIDRRILAYNPKARRCLRLAVAAGVIGAALVVAQAWLLSDVVARVFIDHRTLSDVRGALAVMLLLAAGRAVAVWAGDVLAQRSASHLKGSLRDDLTGRMLDLGPAFVSRERSGELVDVAVRGVEDLDEYIAIYQPLRYLAVLVPVFVAGVILAVDPPTVLVLLITGPTLVLFLALIGGRARELTARRFRELGWMSATFLDLLQGLATLKMFGRSREQVENVRDISGRYGSTTMDVLRTAFETAFVLEISTTIATALVAVEVSLRLMDGGISFQHALFVLIITPEFFAPLRQLATKYHAGAAGRAAAERIFAIIDTPWRAPARPSAQPSLSYIAGDIRFDGVSFAYDEGRRPALRDISVDIRRGESVALVGATGAGKSTVAGLLLRFIEPDSGAIAVGGAPLAPIDPAVWRSQVAWVPQRPYLFFGTVAENIRLARPGATHDELVAAADAANARAFIERMPHGYNTMIGERGARLSGGEAQRIALARAYLKDAPILVLDEATSHLDAGTESTIRESLGRLMRGRTVVIIAHRLDLAFAADRIVMMDEGRIVDAGRHATLLATCAPYRELVASYEAVVP